MMNGRASDDSQPVSVRARAQKRRVPVHVTLPPGLLGLLDAIVEENHTTLTAFVEEAIRLHPAVREALAQLAQHHQQEEA